MISEEDIKSMKDYRKEKFGVNIKKDTTMIYPNSFTIGVTGNGSQWSCITLCSFCEALKLHEELTKYLQSNSVI